LYSPHESNPEGGFRLVHTADRLELHVERRRGWKPIFVDFVRGPTAYRRLTSRGGRELLARAFGPKKSHKTVLDATAGLGRDAFLMAFLGYEVTAVERSPVLAELVWDGLLRAKSSGQSALVRAISRLTLLNADACDVLSKLGISERPDVVYLDPMYPTRGATALVKKEMRILRELVGDDEDAGKLFEIARQKARKRIVVKRHRYAPPLGEAPQCVHRGARIRFDVYLPVG